MTVKYYEFNKQGSRCDMLILVLQIKPFPVWNNGDLFVAEDWAHSLILRIRVASVTEAWFRVQKFFHHGMLR